MIRAYASAGGLVVEAGRVLVLERPGRRELRLPKGHIETGETPRQAALREVGEESGLLELEILADLGRQCVAFALPPDWVLRREHWFLMQPRGPAQRQRPPADAAQFRVRWLEPSQAEAGLSYAAERNVLRKALSRIQDGSLVGA